MEANSNFGLITKISWRNILRHKGKSIVIGVILFLGAFLMTAGNGVISGMERGLVRNIIESFTGDVVLISEKNESDSVILEMMGKAVEPINNFKDIKGILLSQDYIDKFLPAGKNMAMTLYEGGMAPGFAFLLGVDLKEYKKMFPDNFIIVEGKMLNDDEEGMLVPTSARKEYFDYTGIWLIPEGGTLVKENLPEKEKTNMNDVTLKDNAVFMGANSDNTTSDIRLTVKGIVKYKALNTIWGHFTITDIESYRECMGYFSAQDKTDEIAEDKKKLLDLEAQNLDTMFSPESMFVENTGKKDILSGIDFRKKNGIKKENVDLEAGTYNLVFVKLKKGTDLKSSIKTLNNVFKEKNTGIRAVTWKKAAGAIGSMTTIIKGALFVFVMLLFFVAIIIIVNTLNMAALERTSEIGMMRAIGARKEFISRMFLGETVMLSVVFGGAGIILGYLAIRLVPLFNITSQNDMLQLLFGGDKFLPYLSVTDVLTAVFQLALVSIIAVIYPMRIAKNITPLDAISRD